MIVKDSIVLYGHHVTLEDDRAVGKDFVDTSINANNSVFYDGIILPAPFVSGWYTFDGTDFGLTEEGKADYRLYLKKRIKRYVEKYEYGGIVVNGRFVKTTFNSQQYIGSMYNMSKIDSDRVFNFHFADSTWDRLDSTAVELLAFAVASHVEACFDRTYDLFVEIDAADTLEDLRTLKKTIGTGWPEILSDTIPEFRERNPRGFR